MSEIFSTVVKFAPLALTAACGTPVSAGDPTPPLGPMVTSRSTGNGTLTATPITEQAVSDEGGGGYSLPWITPRYSHDNPPTGLATAVGQVYQATEKIQKNAPDSYSTVTVVSPDNQLQATFGPQLVFSGSGASVRWVGLNGGLHLVADGYLEVSPTDGTQSIVARTLPAEQTLLKVEDAISIQQGFNLENGEIGEKIMEQTLRPGMTFGDFAQEAATARTPAEWQNIYYKYFGSVTLFDPSQGTQATKIFDQPNTTAQNGSDNFDNSIEEHLPVKQISQRVTITPSSTNMPPSQTPQPAEATPRVTQIAQVNPTAAPEPTASSSNENLTYRLNDQEIIFTADSSLARLYSIGLKPGQEQAVFDAFNKVIERLGGSKEGGVDTVVGHANAKKITIHYTTDNLPHVNLPNEVGYTAISANPVSQFNIRLDENGELLITVQVSLTELDKTDDPINKEESILNRTVGGLISLDPSLRPVIDADDPNISYSFTNNHPWKAEIATIFIDYANKTGSYAFSVVKLK